MANQQLYMVDGRGVKSVPMESLPASAWSWKTPHLTGDDADVEERYIHVPFLRRAVDLRAKTVAALPFAIVDKASGDQIDGSDDWQNKCGFMPNPGDLFERIEASLCLAGRAYLFRSRNNRDVTLGLRYLLPTSVSPIINEGFDSDGLVGFVRQIGGEKRRFEVDDIVYFWAVDPYREIGPGNNAPAIAALNAAGVLLNVDRFAAEFFERGAIKVTILTVKGPVQQGEKDRLKSIWKKVAAGIRSAWGSFVFNADTITPTVIGEGIGELQDSDLTEEKRIDIAAALAIPVTKIWSSKASGLGGGGVMEGDDRTFYDGCIVPEAKFIAAVLNDQVFNRLGQRLEFRHETLDIYQEDEAQRADAWARYRSGGMSLRLATELMGIELPPGWTYDDLDEKEEPPLQVAQALPDTLPPPMAPEMLEQQERLRAASEKKAAALTDLRKWRTKAKKRGVCDFESEHIPEHLAAAVGKALAEHGAEAAFSFLKAEPGIAAAEARISAKLKRIFEQALGPITLAIQNNGNIDYSALSDQLRAALEPEIVAIAVEQALRVAAEVGVEFDPAMVNDEAASWARGYAFDLVKGLTDTTRNVVSNAIASYTQTPGMTRADLESLLSPAFGEYRASMIAVTETTRAYAQAMNQYQRTIREDAGVEMVRVWQTNNDELVCPVCGPLNGQPESVWRDSFQDGPPAHTNCRCFLTLQYQKKR